MMHTDPSDDDTITEAQRQAIMSRPLSPEAERSLRAQYKQSVSDLRAWADAPCPESTDDLDAFRAVLVGGGISLLLLGGVALIVYIYNR